MSHPIEQPDAFAKEFVDAYDGGHENIHRYYSDDMDWLEMPTGRNGGQKEYVDYFLPITDEPAPFL